jgi:hypothetical protein
MFFDHLIGMILDLTTTVLVITALVISCAALHPASISPPLTTIPRRRGATTGGWLT